MSKQDWEKNHIPSLFSNLPKVESILDVGCGLSLKSKFISAQIRVGVDIYPEYFKHIESKVPYVVIKYDARKLDEIFMPKSFDLVIAFDIIEHLKKPEAKKMIKMCEKIARKAVVLETPNGMVHQNLDITGLGGHEFQTHWCGWTEKELEKMGYDVKVRDYKMDDKRRHTEFDVDPSIQLLDAIKIL